MSEALIGNIYDMLFIGNLENLSFSQSPLSVKSRNGERNYETKTDMI